MYKRQVYILACTLNSNYLLFAQQGNFSQAPPGINSAGNAPPPPKQQQQNNSGNPLINASETTDIISANSGGEQSIVQSGIAVNDNYVIRGGDIISVTVINEPELSVRGIRVTSEGMILLPLLNEVRVLGLTLQRSRESITSQLKKDYLVNPQVVVALEGTSQNEYIMRGQIGGVGVNQIPTDGKITLLKAIYSRGGPTKVANIKRIRITRSGKMTEYNLIKIQKGESTDPEILPGDIIEVPENFF